MSGKGVVVVGRSLTWRDRDHDTKRVVVVVGVLVSFFFILDLCCLIIHIIIPYHGICCRGHNRMRPVFGTSFICALRFLA